MIIVKLIGGLGNQLFQYALGRHLALKNNVELKIDITGFEEYKLHKYSLDAFAIKKNLATANEISSFKKYRIRPGRKWCLYNKLFANPKKFYTEKKFDFDPAVFKLSNDVYLDGYWQTEKYFKDIESTIRHDLSFVLPQSEQDLAITKLIQASNAISIHIRRADYVTDKATNAAHGTCPIEYYEKAVAFIADKITDPKFFVFSDDHAWVKEHIKIPYPTIYVDHNDASRNYQDLHLMSLCKHNIIANSSFSWWGAWLNTNQDKIVIAPKKWFLTQKMNTCDLIPNSWTKL